MPDERLVEVKSLLRGLLISCPRQMTVEELRKDFRRQEGRDIPFRNFGYTSLLAFLKSIPDTINIRGDQVLPVVSEKTAHVDALVTKQKVSKTTNRYVIPPRRRKTLIPSSYYKDRPVSFSDSYTKSRTVVKDTTNGVTPFVPSSVQSALHKLLVQHPEGVRLSVIENEICSKYPLVKYDICGGARELVTLLPHLAKMSNGLIYCAVDEKLSSGSSPNDTLQSPESLSPIHETESRLSNGYEAPKQRTQSSYSKVNLVPAGYESRAEYDQGAWDDGWDYPNSREQIHASSTPVHSINGSSSPVDDTQMDNQFISDSSLGHKHNNPCVNDKVISNFQQILDAHPDGVWCAELPDKYREKFGSSLNFRSYGFTSMVQMAADLPEVFHVLRPDGNDFMLLDARKPVPPRFTNHDLFSPEYERHHNYPDNASVPILIQKNIMRLLQEYPDGIKEEVFPTKYEDRYMSSLCIYKMGFSSLHSFLQYLMEMNVLQLGVVQDSSEGEVTVILSVEAKNDLDDAESFEIPTTVQAPDLSLYPANVLGPYDDIPQQLVPSHVVEKNFIEVMVGEIRNPSLFWVQLCGPNYNDSLQSLMDDMQGFYVAHMYEYRIPKGAIQVNLLCAACYASDWHRARISKIISPEKVELYYIDYGTICPSNTSELCFLLKGYQDLPAQAIKCSLANLKPANGAINWSGAASKRFLEMVCERPLVVRKCSIDPKNQSFTAALVDTSGKEDFHINDNLVREGYAEFINPVGDDSPVEEKPTAIEDPPDSTTRPRTPEPQCLPSSTVPSSPFKNQQSMYANLGSRNGPSLELPLQANPAGLRSRTGLGLESPVKAEHAIKTVVASERVLEVLPIQVNSSSVLSNGKDLELPSNQENSSPVSSIGKDIEPPTIQVNSSSSSSNSSLSSFSNGEPSVKNTAHSPQSSVDHWKNIPVQPSRNLEQPKVVRPPPGFPAKSPPWGLTGIAPEMGQQSNAYGMNSGLSRPRTNDAYSFSRNVEQTMSSNAFLNNNFTPNQTFSAPNNSFGPQVNYSVPLSNSPYPSVDYLAFQQQFYMQQQLRQQYLQQLQTASPLLMYNQTMVPNLCNQPAFVNSILNSALVLPPRVNGPHPGHLPSPSFRTADLHVFGKNPQLPTQKISSQPYVQTRKGSVPTNPSIDPSVIVYGSVSTGVSAINIETEDKSLNSSGDSVARTEEVLELLDFRRELHDLNRELQEKVMVEDSVEPEQVDECRTDSGLASSLAESQSRDEKKVSTSESEEHYSNLGTSPETVREDDFVSATSDPPESVSSSNHIEEYDDIVYRSDSEKDDNSIIGSEEGEDDLDADVVVEEVRDFIPLEPHCVKEIFIAGKKVVLLNVDNAPFLCTDQFVPLFTPFTTRFAVTKILESYNIQIPFREADRKDHPELYSSLEAISTEYLKKSSDGKITKRIHMIPLKSTLEVLKALHLNTDLQNAFQFEIDNFNPRDVYWTGNTW